MDIKAIIFDMDGVLVDSEPAYLDFFRSFFRQHGHTTDEALLLRTVGASHKETWRLLAQMWGEDCDPLWLEELCYGTTRHALPYRELVFPGMQDTLKFLYEKGISLYIASASSQPSIQRMVEETGIAPYLSGAISGETVRRSKPDPDVYLQAIALSGYPAEQCLAVEDSIYGIQAARNAHLTVVGVYSALFPENQALADYQIPTVADLPALLFPESSR